VGRAAEAGTPPGRSVATILDARSDTLFPGKFLEKLSVHGWENLARRDEPAEQNKYITPAHPLAATICAE